MNKYARYVVATILFLLFTPLSVSGHFIWIERDKESGEIRAYFGEEPKADKHALLDRVMGTEVWLIKDGEAQSVPMEKFMTGDYGYLVSQYETVGNEIDASCVYGVFSRGESKMLLNY